MSDTTGDWDLYRSFLAVHKEGSLSAAARSLGLTQPTVGRHIDQLERSAGTPLFIRSSQGLLATETARSMLPYAESMRSAAAALLRTASSSNSSPEGRVRISCSEVMAVEVLPSILANLQTRYPKLVVELSSSDALEDLGRQEADIAVRLVKPVQAALVSKKIGAIPLGFFAHRRYLDACPAPRNLAELQDHRLIGFDRFLTYVRTALKDVPALDNIDFAFRSDSNLAQLAMIRAAGGIGICQVPIGLRAPDLLEVLPDQFPLALETYVVMHENLKTSPRCRVTFDALVEGLIAYRAIALDR